MMPCMIALLILCVVLALALAAEGQLVVNDCDDAGAWEGGGPEAELVKQGAGAVRWVPSEHVGLSTGNIPHDWTGGNCLSFWLHSARATGSRIWLIIPSPITMTGLRQ